ncbi:hypothetical protein H6796_00915 [Candidatus Nomurabacteria bacterium]|nr:hypothetical protein [Candidatus Nomurabacteria bacterium]
MQLTTSLINNIKSLYPQFKYEAGNDFSWNPSNDTIYYAVEHLNGLDQMLHELAHALLDHRNFSKDIELISLERDAWRYAKNELATKLEHKIQDSSIESHLDTYRDWLHKRSTCPKCESTGLQQDSSHYSCITCGQGWRVNDARSCGLRRYVIKK